MKAPVSFWGPMDPMVDRGLTYRFGPSSTSLARSQFHTAKRRTNEGVIDFANRLRGLLAEAYPSLPSSNAKELLIQQFIDGIVDVTIRRHIVANNCLSLESAVDLKKKKFYRKLAFVQLRRDNPSALP